MPSVPRSARARPPTSNRSGRSASRSSRITCCLPAGLNAVSDSKPQKPQAFTSSCPSGFSTSEPHCGQRRALDLDDVFHVAADLLERFAERLRRIRLAQQPVEPRQVDADYRHRLELRHLAASPSDVASPFTIGIAAPLRARRGSADTARGCRRGRTAAWPAARCPGPRRAPATCSPAAASPPAGRCPPRPFRATCRAIPCTRPRRRSARCTDRTPA